MTSSPVSSLKHLASSEQHRDQFVQACKDAVVGGAPVSDIIDAINGTRWRFILTKSGRDIEVEHKDDLYADYWSAVSGLKACRSIVGKEEYEELLADHIRECRTAYDRAKMFITDDDSIGGNVDRAIAELFDGTGFRFNGARAEYVGDDAED